MSPPIDPSILNELVQLLHHTTTSGKPVSHTLLFRSQANPLGWTVQLYEWGKDEGGATRWKGWEGGWTGGEGLKEMAALIPDMSTGAFTRRISNHICSGHLRVEGFKTGFEDSFKLSITHPENTFSPFIISMASLPAELVAQQGFDFLRDSIASNSTHRIGPPPRDATHSPEVALDTLPDVAEKLEDLKAALEREKKAHRNTKAQLEASEAQGEPESQKTSIPVFRSRVGFSTANANFKAPRPERPTFDDDPNIDTSDASDTPQQPPKKSGSFVGQVASGSETEPEEDEDAAMDEEFSQKTLQASSQAQSQPFFPKSPSKPPTPSKHNPTSSQMLPPPTPTSSARSKPSSSQQHKSPVASGSKLSPSKISPRKNLLAKKSNSNASDDSMDDSPTFNTASSKKKKEGGGGVKKSGSTLMKPLPRSKKLTGRALAKKRATFGEDSSSSSDDAPAAKKAKMVQPPSSSKGKRKEKMVADRDGEKGGESGSETE